jgi:hypothetical protein
MEALHSNVTRGTTAIEFNLTAHYLLRYTPGAVRVTSANSVPAPQQNCQCHPRGSRALCGDHDGRRFQIEDICHRTFLSGHPKAAHPSPIAAS